MTEPINANDDKQPNNDQPTERRLSPDQRSEWGDTLNLDVPDPTDEKGNKPRGGASADLAEVQGVEEKTTEKPEDDVAPEPGEEEIDDDTEVPQVVTLEDPGTYTPADYSFNVVVYTGEEGKERPKTVKVTSVDQAESLLEEDPNFGSAKNLLDFNRKLARMESSLERDEREFKQKKEAYDAQLGVQAERDVYVESVTKGINYLVSKGKLPKVDPKFQTANWNDPEVQKQPGVKEQVALLSYMTKENKARDKAGIPRVTATEAFTEMQLDNKLSESEQAKQAAATKRKEAGAKVAGSSPAPITGSAPKGVAVGRVSGSGLQGLGGSGW